MSERWPKFGSKPQAAEPEASAPLSANGSDPAEREGVPEPSADPPIAAAAGSNEEPVPAARIIAAVTSTPAQATVGDQTATSSAKEAATVESAAPPWEEKAAIVPEATAAPEAAPAPEATAAPEAASALEAGPALEAPADDGSLFLAELVRAMRTTVGIERSRIGEDADRRRQALIDQVRARQALEADRMRELAGQDKRAIDAWAEGETRRILAERERREKELNADLETSLAGHRARVDQEIERVEAAVALYRAEVNAFFEGLDRETDPVLIAQHAALRPVFPKLDAVAEAPGSTEPTMVGVMAAEALAARIASWPSGSTNAADATAASSNATGAVGEVREPAEPAVEAAASGSGGGESLLEAVPSVRPMSWLRRASGGGDDGSNRQE
jgi:hypothetical protein